MALVNALLSPRTFTRVSLMHQSLVCVHACVLGENQGTGQTPLPSLEEGSNVRNREGMHRRHPIETEVQSQWPETIHTPKFVKVWGALRTSKGLGMGV